MPTLAKITPDMLPEVYALLEEFDPSIAPAHWSRLFEHGWTPEGDHQGHVLLDSGRIVGMLGAIFSERVIEGNHIRFCNPFSWYVKPEFRAGSVLLLRPILSLKEHVVTDFSAAPVVIEMLKRFGFTSLDREAIMMPALGPLAGASTDCEIVAASADDMAECADSDRQIFTDHQCAPVGHMLLRDGRHYCYAVYSRVERHPIPYCLVHYVSDPALFVTHHCAARTFLMQQTRSKCVGIDSRLLGEMKVPFSFRTVANEKLVRGPAIAPRHVDTLYSEMPLLGLSTLLTLRGRLTITAKKYLPDRAVSMLKSALGRGRRAESNSA